MSPQQCPICGVRVEPNSRYPRYVCERCAQRACAHDGRLLRFENADGSGGFVARYADSGEEHAGHECYIDGVACRADEARFGGIVIQVSESTGQGRAFDS